MSFVLDNSTRSLEVVLAAPEATSPLPFATTYADFDPSALSVRGTQSLLGTTAGTAAVTVLPPAPSDLSRKLRHFTLLNADTAPATVTVRFNDNGTLYGLFVLTLSVGDQVQWADGKVLHVLDASGNVKTAGNNGATSNLFAAAQEIDTNSAAAFLVEQGGVFDNTLLVNTASGRVGVGHAPAGLLDVLGYPAPAVSSGLGKAAEAIVITGGTGGTNTGPLGGPGQRGGTGGPLTLTGGTGGVYAGVGANSRGGPGGAVTLAPGGGGAQALGGAVNNTGGASGNFIVFAAIAGNASGATSGTNTGGTGGTISISGQGGGDASNSSTLNVGGVGGNYVLQGASGGDATGTGASVNTSGVGSPVNITGGPAGHASGGATANGGAGGNVVITAGQGDSPAGATANNGGASGSVLVTAPAGGTGSTSNGANGTVQFNTGGKNNFLLDGAGLPTFQVSPSSPSPGSGTHNEAWGSGAGAGLTTGHDNTFLGYQAGNALTTHFQNVFVGTQAGGSAQTDYCVYLGYQAGQNSTAQESVAIGVNAGGSDTGNRNVFIGSHSGSANTSGSTNVFIGYQAGNAVTTTSGEVMVGQSAGANTTGSQCCFLGGLAGNVNTTGTNNTAVGYGAGWNNDTSTTAHDWTVIGFEAIAANHNYVVCLGSLAAATADSEFCLSPRLNFQSLHQLDAASADVIAGKLTWSLPTNTHGATTGRVTLAATDASGDREVLRADADGTAGNLSLFGAGSYGGGENVVFVPNRNAAPSSNPTGGGILYVEAGALKYRGSGGTVTTLAPA